MSDKEYHPDDDAELEEFLQGRGELARHLQTLPQAAPSAELDQAIMAKVEAGLKQAVPAPMPAANDARIPDSDGGNHAPARRRWWLGAPLTTAASVAIVGFLGLQWRHQLELDAPASPPTQVTEVAEVAEPAQTNPGAGASPEPQAPQTLPAPLPAPPAPQPPVSAAPPAPAAPPAARVSQSMPPSAPAAKMAAPMATAAETEKAAIAPARPERADAAPAAPSQAGRIEITGSAIRSAAPAAPIAPASPIVAPAPAPATPAPTAAPIATTTAQGAARFAAADAVGASRKESQPTGFSQQQAREARDWLALIEELLKADLRQDALNEWGKFHQAYPDYPVPEQVSAQIRALQK
ncbi:MAG: hypothetical protein V4488_00295 [Pseudomonadota bacterium]